MDEGYCRREIVPAMIELGAHALPVENSVHDGTPDINWAFEGREGWVELKYLDRFPVRKGIVRIEHYTQQQRLFAACRMQSGGNWALILIVGKGAERECVAFTGAKGLLVGTKDAAWLHKNMDWGGSMSWDMIAKHVVYCM